MQVKKGTNCLDMIKSKWVQKPQKQNWIRRKM